MADLETFRDDAPRWLDANAPASMSTPPRTPEDVCWGGRKTRYPEDVKRWLDVMVERGWTAPSWPREYGGGGLAKDEAKVLAAELAKRTPRPPLIGFRPTMIRPPPLQGGSEQQKRGHLPKIGRGENRLGQGDSEP